MENTTVRRQYRGGNKPEMDQPIGDWRGPGMPKNPIREGEPKPTFPIPKPMPKKKPLPLPIIRRVPRPIAKKPKMEDIPKVIDDKILFPTEDKKKVDIRRLALGRM